MASRSDRSQSTMRIRTGEGALNTCKADALNLSCGAIPKVANNKKRCIFPKIKRNRFVEPKKKKSKVPSTTKRLSDRKSTSSTTTATTNSSSSNKRIIDDSVRENYGYLTGLVGDSRSIAIASPIKIKHAAKQSPATLNEMMSNDRRYHRDMFGIFPNLGVKKVRLMA
mmetsp:Transcript_15643/g.17391  ORF Transcript_15643/g.17391 Transcript_15643/m.17391 type:complete len:168 (-) Transcript_15643:404-907(-)|eukprot:CAMPEP_0115010120 /NCGR_PEP_ID=MMETSP0216-20121206/23097_1 /TAXON_ID=223996 /ORGANISM="Protocruzia adherens, Strain Boccale" /LENGTH=167 /DNA_ID=CAMNT_0002378215 /DNA_START=33 /DNA_END=536 /DNA_ORIENTATION=-